MKTFLALLIVLAALPAAADVYQCIGPDGAVLYTDEGCPAGWREVARRPDAVDPQPRELQRPKVPLTDRLTGLWSKGDVGKFVFPYGAPALYGIMSVICFMAYRRDKQRAMHRQWRISESRLHLLELAGGWPGGLLAQIALRHKIGKPAYLARFWGIVGLHALGWVDVWRGYPWSRQVIHWIQAFV